MGKFWKKLNNKDLKSLRGGDHGDDFPGQSKRKGHTQNKGQFKAQGNAFGTTKHQPTPDPTPKAR